MVKTTNQFNNGCFCSILHHRRADLMQPWTQARRWHKWLVAGEWRLSSNRFERDWGSLQGWHFGDPGESWWCVRQRVGNGLLLLHANLLQGHTCRLDDTSSWFGSESVPPNLHLPENCCHWVVRPKSARWWPQASPSPTINARFIADLLEPEIGRIARKQSPTLESFFVFDVPGNGL